jgi:hypothetical protein
LGDRQPESWIDNRGVTEWHILVLSAGRAIPMEGCEVVDYCPDCLENDELVKMEKHEWPAEGYVKLVCPACGCEMLGRKEEGEKDE